MSELLITIEKFYPDVFSPIFQHGFMIKVLTGKSIREILHTQLGLSADYVENRISTIFLDGKPVDDIDASHVKDKATLSLSSAMPGLVGATMRRSGFYASFRENITYKDEDNIFENKAGMLRIKLFNLVKEEIGKDLLRKGIYVSSDDIKSLQMNKDHNFIKNCVSLQVDGKDTDCGILSEGRLHMSDLICIKLI